MEEEYLLINPQQEENYKQKIRRLLRKREERVMMEQTNVKWKEVE